MTAGTFPFMGREEGTGRRSSESGDPETFPRATNFDLDTPFMVV